MKRLAVLCVGAVLALGSSKAFADDLYYGQGIARGGCYVPPHHHHHHRSGYRPPIVLSPYGVSPYYGYGSGLGYGSGYGYGYSSYRPYYGSGLNVGVGNAPFPPYGAYGIGSPFSRGPGVSLYIGR